MSLEDNAYNHKCQGLTFVTQIGFPSHYFQSLSTPKLSEPYYD